MDEFDLKAALVGGCMIDVKPTYGIYGISEPALIDKTGSHGSIGLANCNAEELATMVAPGGTVTFL